MPHKGKYYTNMHSYLVLVQPADDLIALVQNLLLVLITDFTSELLILYGRLHVEGVRLQRSFRGHLGTLDIILSLVFLSILDHALNVLFTETAWVHKTIEYFVKLLLHRTGNDSWHLQIVSENIKSTHVEAISTTAATIYYFVNYSIDCFSIN